jgi:hypothetical protein
MADKTFCDYCAEEIHKKAKVFDVSIVDRNAIPNDDEEWERNACAGCADIIRRLLSKPLARLKLAIEAASDR